MANDNLAEADTPKTAASTDEDFDSPEHAELEGEISEEEQKLLDSIDDPASFTNLVDEIPPDKTPDKEEKPEEDQEESEESEEESQDEDDEEESDEDDEEESDEDEEEDEESDDQPETDDGEEEEESQEKSVGKRFRLRTQDPVEQRALELRKNNRDLTLKECMERAESELGVKDETPTDGEAPESTEDGTDLSLADIDAKIVELRAGLKEAINEFETDKQIEITDQLFDLAAQKSQLQLDNYAKKHEKLKEAESLFNQEKSKAEQKAVQLYPFVTNSESPENKEMWEIYDRLKEANDPLCTSPDLSLKLAQMVAARRGIAPKGRNISAKKGVRAKEDKSPSKKKRVQPASAKARTVPKSNSDQLDKQIDKIDNPHAYEELIGSL